MQGHGWRRSIVDAACCFFWENTDGMDRLEGMIVAHEQLALNLVLGPWILAVLHGVESASVVQKITLFV